MSLNFIFKSLRPKYNLLWNKCGVSFFWLYGTHITKYYYLLPNTCDFYVLLFENAEFYTRVQAHRLPVNTMSTKLPRLTPPTLLSDSTEQV